MTTATKSRFNAPKASTTQARAPKVPKAPKASTTQRTAPTVDADVHAEVHAASFDGADQLFVLPSGTKLFISTVAGLVAYASSMYWAVNAGSWLSMAALAFTGSGFISFVTLVVGWVMAILASLRLGYQVFKFCVGYQPGDLAGVGRSIKESAASKVSPLVGWFKRGDKVVA